jgi:hypothetical protein
MKKPILITLAACIMLQSCATVFSGANAKIKIPNGAPDGGKIYVDGKYEGNAPHIVVVPKAALKEGVTISVKSGDKESVTKVRRKAMAGWIIADIFLGGIIAIGIDFLTGNIYTSNPKTVTYSIEQ